MIFINIYNFHTKREALIFHSMRSEGNTKRQNDWSKEETK